MNVNLSSIAPALILVGGIIFGYAQLTSKVDAYEAFDDKDLLRLTDDNMNRIIALEVKLEIAEKAFNIYTGSQ